MGAQRIAVIGAGAIGGVLAAAAHAAGHIVTLCVRTPFDRLVVETPEGPQDIPATIIADPGAAPEVDWVLLTTKVQDVASATAWLRKLDNGRAPVVVVQNGVEHQESVAPLGLRAPMLPALVYVSAERVRPGHVLQRSGTSIIVPDGELATGFGALTTGSGLTVSGTDDFPTAAWRKLLANLAANPITALTMRRLDIFTDPDVRELAEGVLAEGVAVARAEGAQITAADADEVIAAYTDYFSPDSGTSMLYDRLAGLPTEHEHITGPLVRAGRRHGIPTPLNDALLALMRALRPSSH